METESVSSQGHDFAHPWERDGGAWAFLFQTYPRQVTAGDEFEVVLHHRGVHIQYTARHGVASVFRLLVRCPSLLGQSDTLPSASLRARLN